MVKQQRSPASAVRLACSVRAGRPGTDDGQPRGVVVVKAAGPCGCVHVMPRPWTVRTTRKTASKVAVCGSWLTVSSLYRV